MWYIVDATKGFDYIRRTVLIIRHNSYVTDEVQKLGTADSSEDSLTKELGTCTKHGSLFTS